MSEVIPPVKAVYAHGDTVTVSIIKDSDGTAIVSGAACVEIGNSGIFKYQPVFTPPSSLTTYSAIFSNGTYSQTGELILGGYDYQAAQLDIPTAEEIDSELSSAHGLGTWGSDESGSETYTDIVHDPGGIPLEGAKIEAYSNSDRTSIVDMTTTNINGVFVLHLYPGTYYMRAKKKGYSFDDWQKVIE